jgi:hypothetical protein
MRKLFLLATYLPQWLGSCVIADFADNQVRIMFFFHVQGV